MQEQLLQIAERLRGLRESADVPAEVLAAQLGLTVAMYERYESGTTDIPISVLYQIANFFRVELSAMLTGDGPRLHTYSLVRNGKGVHVARREAYDYQHLAFNFAHKKAEPFLVTVTPKPADTPLSLNTHPGQEFTYVLSGTLLLSIDGHLLELHPGDTLYFDATVPHGMQALGDQPAEFLAIII